MVHPAVLQEYFEELNYSQGFYVTARDDDMFQTPGGIRQIVSNPDIYQAAEKAARFAVDEHNKAEKKNIKFLKIVVLNHEPTVRARYYITLACWDSSSSRVDYYEAKIWEKFSTGYKIELFRIAPYHAQAPGCVKDGDVFNVWIHYLEPWMNENYFYYKCFPTSQRKIVSVRVVRLMHKSYGVVAFKTSTDAENFIKEYNKGVMPLTDEDYYAIPFKLELEPS